MAPFLIQWNGRVPGDEAEACLTPHGRRRRETQSIRVEVFIVSTRLKLKIETCLEQLVHTRVSEVGLEPILRTNDVEQRQVERGLDVDSRVVPQARDMRESLLIKGRGQVEVVYKECDIVVRLERSTMLLSLASNLKK